MYAVCSLAPNSPFAAKIPGNVRMYPTMNRTGMRYAAPSAASDMRPLCKNWLKNTYAETSSVAMIAQITIGRKEDTTAAAPRPKQVASIATASIPSAMETAVRRSGLPAFEVARFAAAGC